MTTPKLRIGGLAVIAAMALTACNQRENQPTFDGESFRAKASKVDGDRQQFSINVRPVSASLVGALEAGEYEAIRYCVLTYGNSEIDWVLGPDEDPESYMIDGDTLNLRGACRG